MHLLLTDRLSCPRCGPTFGLILRADRQRDRLVLDGALGCPNCRDSFAVVDGFADLRAPPRGELGPGYAGPAPPDAVPGTAPDESAERLVALLGVVGGPGTIALVGEPARLARSVADALPEARVVAVDPDLRSWPETPEVSRVAAAPGLPFFTASLRGVALDGRLGKALLVEAARVVHARARVVVVRAAAGTADVLEERGLKVLAQEAETVVAARG